MKDFPDLSLPLTDEEILFPLALNQQKTFELSDPIRFLDPFEFLLVCPTCKRPFVEIKSDFGDGVERPSLFKEKVPIIVQFVAAVVVVSIVTTLMAVTLALIIAFRAS